jgi:hypothetical protein
LPTYDLGDGVNLRRIVRDRDGALTDATVALAITRPDGDDGNPSVNRTSLGQYDAATYVPDLSGRYSYKWTVTGAVTDVSYGTFTVANPAPALYADLALVKEMLSKESEDARDVLVLQSIRSASRLIDKRTGRRFYADAEPVTRTYSTSGRVYYDRVSGSYQFLIPDIADDTGMTVELGAGSAWNITTGFAAGPDNALLMGRPITRLSNTGGWGTSSVRINARWGWPEVPDEVQQAAALLAARLYRRKDSPQGVIGGGEFGPVRVSRFDPDVEALIADLILPGFA